MQMTRPGHDRGSSEGMAIVSFLLPLSLLLNPKFLLESGSLKALVFSKIHL